MGLSNKTITFSKEARLKLKAGLDQLAKAVLSTLGPKGRNVIIDKELTNAPIVTKDGVTVAKEVELIDKVENSAVRIARQAALETNKITGDGTTTSIVLTQSIFNEGLKYIDPIEKDKQGSNPIDLIRGMNKAKNIVHEYLVSIKKEIKNKSDIQNVATISANGDVEMGSLIAEAMEKIKQDGVIVVEESKTTKTTVETTDGMKYDGSGYYHSVFAKDQKKMKTELENVPVLIVNKTFTSHIELINILAFFAHKGIKDAVLIADDFTGNSIDMIIQNFMRDTVRIYPVKSPSYGDKRKEILIDIATFVGGEVINEDTLKTTSAKIEEFGSPSAPAAMSGTNIKIKQNLESYIGKVGKIIIDANSVTFIEGDGDKKLVDERIATIREQKAKSEVEYDKELFQKRIARMTSGIAQIKIGAPTEAEVKEKKDRAEDAVGSTRAAIEEGIVPGGGVALVRASQHLKEKMKTEIFVNADQELGYKIIQDAILYPLRIIVRNAGLNEEEILNEVMNNSSNVNYGFNAATEKYGDLIMEGVIDPVLVTKVALENAVSSASMLLTTECVLEEEMDIKLKMQMLDPSNQQY
jgi:chaperonin GroEL